jgi:Fe-S cluster assembly protein SufD
MMRENYLKKFHELKLENIKNGLGILTLMDWIDIDKHYTDSGSTHIDSNIKVFDESQIEELDTADKTEILKIINAPSLENKLDYLHAALRQIKIVIIDKDVTTDTIKGKLITIDRKISGNQYNHLIIYVKENINATININTIAINNLSTATEFLDIIIKDNSEVNIIDSRNYGTEYLIYSRKESHLGNNSCIKWTNIEGPAKLNITSIISRINGHHSRSLMNTLLLSRNSEYNIFMRTDHNSKDTKSLMYSRAIMNRSKTIMRGLVYIDESANNSNGYQKTEMLMLDDESRAVSIPDLEIHNDDVKCTHGSSISRLDSEQMFYVQSRGLDAADSQKLLIQGFYEKILEHIPEHLKNVIRENIEEILYLQE